MAKATRVQALGRRTPLLIAGPLLLRARIADVRSREPALGVAGEPDAEAVHDARVAARRLRVALEALGDAQLAGLEPQVKALQDALGALREVQVHRSWVLEHGEDEEARRLAERIDAARAEAEGELREVLGAWSSAVAPALERLALGVSPRGRLGGRPLARQVRAAVQRLGRRLDALDRTLDPTATHRVRVAAKRLRYLTELVAPGHRRRAKRLLRQLEPFLERLGEVRDLDIRARILDRLAGPEAEPRERAAARALQLAVRAERGRRAAALSHELERWRSEDVLGAARRAFARRPSGAPLRALSRPRHEDGAQRPAPGRSAPSAPAG